MYVDNILIFINNNLKNYKNKVKKVLRRFINVRLQLNIDKYVFNSYKIYYFGFVIKAGNRIFIDLAKVIIIKKWQLSLLIKGVRGFLGFVNYYRTFFNYFSDLLAPFNALIYKSAPKFFQWTSEVNNIFNLLKELFIIKLIFI